MKHRWALVILFLPFACSDGAGPTDPNSSTPAVDVDDSPFGEPLQSDPSLAVGEISIAIDVRPNTAVNPIVLHSGGVVPVALLAEPGFDPSTVDPASLAFGPPAGPFAMTLHDLSTDCALDDHLQDVDGDGDVDLVTHYAVGDLGFTTESVEGCVVGNLQAGSAFLGCDDVVIRP